MSRHDAVGRIGRAQYPEGVQVMDRITVDPGVCGGQPCVRGLRVPVSLILRHVAAGQSPAQIVGEYPELEPEDIPACLRFAAWLASGRSLELSRVA
ncbi:MAG: hypothetical protein OHK0013_01850 [Sandaracinaceae bacterium]